MMASAASENSEKDGKSESTGGCSKPGSMCIYKLFYFFYIGAQAAKLIMLPLYLKQLRLPAKYAGLIAGVAPFGSGAGAPLLGYFADSTNTRKAMFLFSLTMLTITPLVCLLPQPKYICDTRFTENSTAVAQGHLPSEFKESSVIPNGSRTFQNSQATLLKDNKINHSIAHSRKDAIETRLRVKNIFNFHGNKTAVKTQNGVNQRASQFNGINPTRETERQEVDDLFIMLLILLLLGEVLSAPAQNLADATTVCALGENHEDYGKVRMFGSVGTVAATLPIVFMARYNQFTVCGKPKDDFEITLYVIAGFSAIALFVGVWFPVDQTNKFMDQTNKSIDQTNTSMDQTNTFMDQTNKFMDQTDKSMDQTDKSMDQTNTFMDQTNKFMDQTNRFIEIKESEEEEAFSLKEVICSFRSVTFLITVFYLGVCMGVFYTFMFWYLDDIAPDQVPYVVATAICLRNIGLMSAFRLSGAALRKFGSVNVINCAMATMIPAFMVYGYLQNAWIAIIPEILQNVAYGFGWTGSVAFYSEKYPRNLAATTQGQ